MLNLKTGSVELRKRPAYYSAKKPVPCVNRAKNNQVELLLPRISGQRSFGQED